MNAHPALAADEAGQAALQEEARNVALRNTMRVQRIQDFIFHKVTLLFAASVLIVLVGIIISLAIGAAPAFREFGASFLITNEWDPVNDKFGALIAINSCLVVFDWLPIPPLPAGGLLRHLGYISEETYTNIARWSGLVIIILINIKPVAVVFGILQGIVALPFYLIMERIAI